MMSLVLLAAYSASLISSLAVDHRHLPFTDLQGLLHDGSYKLGVVENTSNFNIFDVWSRYTSHYWLIQLHNLKLNGIRITRYNIRISALCPTQYMYVWYVSMYLWYVCIYVYMLVYNYACKYASPYVCVYVCMIQGWHFWKYIPFITLNNVKISPQTDII